MRKHETLKDYKTLKDGAVKWEMAVNLKTLGDYLSKLSKEGTLTRDKAVKVSLALNNLLKDLGID